MTARRLLIVAFFLPSLLGLMACARTADKGPMEILASAVTAGDLEQIQLATNVALESLPSDVVNAWENSASGHSGTITPLKTIKIDQPRGFCRVYLNEVFDRSTLTVLQKSRLMACRTSRFNWVHCSTNAESCVRANSSQ